MLGENLAALVLLYARPVSAASRILDRGRLWFALLAAVIVSVLVHVPQSRIMAEIASQQVEHAPDSAKQPQEESPSARSRPNFSEAALMQWIGLSPTAFLSPIGALALAFIPAVIFARAVSGSGSFGVLMRSDYLSLLMCVAMAWAAAYLPAVFVSLAVGSRIGLIPVFVTTSLYFAALAAIVMRTAVGISTAQAVLFSAIGWVCAVVGLALYDIAGPMRYYMMSPFFLYYGYSLFASDFRSLGDGLRSRQHFQQQLEAATNNPRDADAHYQLGLIYQKRRQLSEAIARFKRAVEIDPNEPDPHFQLGRIAREQERFDDAIRELKMAASLDDKLQQNDVWREFGAALFSAGNVEAAAVALAKFTDRRPYDPEGLYWYGKTLKKLGRAAEAREMFERAIEAVNTMPRHRRAEVRQWGSKSKSEL